MLSSASVFILLPLLFLPKVYGEKSSSHKYVVQRGRSILIAYLNNCVYSMILHPKSIDESFLKITCHVESENIQWSFLLYYIKIYWSNLNFKWIFTVFDFVTYTLVIWKILVCWAWQTFLILKHPKLYLFISLPISWEVFKY